MRASVDGRAVVLGRRGDRAVLAVLALAAPHPVPADDLLDALWGDDSPLSATKIVQNHILRLRKAAGDAGASEVAILTNGRGYRLSGHPSQVDLWRAEQHIKQARAATARGDHARAAQLWSDVLGHWRGEPLADVATMPFALNERARLIELRWTAVEERFAAELRCGRAEAVVDDLRSAWAAAPTRERLARHVIRALDGCGRRSEALRAYESLERILADELGVPPSKQSLELYRSVRNGRRFLRSGSSESIDPAGPANETAARTRPVPSRTVVPVPRARFIGRQRDIVEVSDLLAGTGIVTIVGPGGVGKTRLAVQIATLDSVAYTDGPFFVELATVADPAQVLPTIADLFLPTNRPEDGRPLLDQLVDLLHGARCLVIFDNCEHVLATVAPLVETLLPRCPGVRLLATSREPLHVDGEAIWRLAPLPVPDLTGTVRPADIDAAAGSRLLVDRARLSRPDLVVDDQTAPLFAAIAHALDGLPLALELAAAMLSELDLATLAARLDDRFAVLVSQRRHGPDRQRTLHAAIDWSYQLLAHSEQVVLRRMSVLSAPAALEAISQVVDFDGQGKDALPSIRRLVDRSLLEMVSGQRYRMLETVRAFAREQLVAQGEAAATNRAWERWAVGVLRAHGEAIRRSGRRGAMRAVGVDYPNLVGALGVAIEQGDVDEAAHLVVDLAGYWSRRGLHHEGIRFTDAVLTVDRNADSVDDARAARLLQSRNALGWLTEDIGDTAAATEAVRRARLSGDRLLLSSCLADLGFREREGETGDPARAEAAFVEAADLARAAGDPAAEGIAVARLAVVRSYAARHTEAMTLMLRARDLLTGTSYDVELFWVRSSIASELYLSRRFDEAAAEINSVLSIVRSIDYPVGEEWTRLVAAQVALARGRLDEAFEHLAVVAQLAVDLEDRKHTGWRRALHSRVLLAAGDAQAATAALELAEVPAEASGRARSAVALVPVLVACEEFALASELISAVSQLSASTLRDPLVTDDLTWCRAELRARDYPADPAAGGAATEDLVDRIHNAASVIAETIGDVIAPPFPRGAGHIANPGRNVG